MKASLPFSAALRASSKPKPSLATLSAVKSITVRRKGSSGPAQANSGLGPIPFLAAPLKSGMRQRTENSPEPDGIPSEKMRGVESKKGAGIGARVGGEGAQD